MKEFPAKDQRGIGQLGLILVVVAVLAVGAIGWIMYDKNTNQDATDTVSETLRNAQCDYDDKELCKFFTTWKAQQHYTVTSNSEVDGKKITTIMEIEGANKSHLKLDGGLEYDVITIDKTTYTKAGNTWWKQTTPNETAQQYQNNSTFNLSEPTRPEAASQSKFSYRKLDKEDCGNLNCFKYEVTRSDDTANKTHIWFDDQDYQLRRWQTVNSGGKTVFDATYSYDLVSIGEPSPVKELAPNQYIVPGQSEPVTLPSAGDGEPTPEELQQLMEQYQ
jgi:outer membrane lipoprotein-sorting protein